MAHDFTLTGKRLNDEYVHRNASAQATFCIAFCLAAGCFVAGFAIAHEWARFVETITETLMRIPQ